MTIGYKIHWIESERGWGTRPDGTTLHIDEATAKQYIDDYWAKQPDETPDEYSAPNEPVRCKIPNELLERVQTEKSIWWDTTKWM